MMIGVDIVKHDRINLDLAEKILSDEEIEQFSTINNKAAKIEYLASRFAAKEAIIKATNNKYKLKEMSILRTGSVPYINIKGIKLSLSHEKDYSIAFCIYESEE